MPALNIDLALEQGSTFVLEFQVFDDLLSPIELLEAYVDENGTTKYQFTDFSARMKIKKSKYRTPELYVCGTTMNYITQPGDTAGFITDGIFFLGGSTGHMRIVITSDTTATFKAGRYFYDLELVENAGGEVVSKLLGGKFEIDAEATK